ncbi:MAG: alanine racemase [Halomonadaceae bacterium]|nr:MAG: alanine racemase [Halomonadaceae bacterium]
MPRHTRALIDASALQHNYRLAAQQASPAQAMAVVKADGYGHGLLNVLSALDDQVPCYAVATVEEGVSIRQWGSRHPVVLLEGTHDPEDWALCVRHQLQPVLHSPHQIDQLAAFTRQNPAHPGITLWLKCNTGMNRLGFAPAEIPPVIEQLQALPEVTLLGLMTHFARADDLDNAMTARQNAEISVLARRYPHLSISTGNSAAHYHHNDLFHWTRPGIMLYGGSPLLSARGPALGLQPAMQLLSRIIAVRALSPGDSVGYGASWTASTPGRMGIVEIGYGDGYPRHAPSGTPVAVGGQRVPLIGRVSMDMLAVDLTTVPGLGVGAPVELWGQTVSVDEVAEWAGTISYALLTGVLPRVPRLPA